MATVETEKEPEVETRPPTEQPAAVQVAVKAAEGNTSRDSGHESSASGTPDAERALTPESKPVEGEDAGSEAVYIIHIESNNNNEKFDVQVNSSEMIQEIHQVLLEREATCHRTCFSLQLNGRSLDHFSEIRNVQGMKNGSTLHVVEEPYTLREARIHVRHVRELSRCADAAESSSAVDGSSLSYLPVIGLAEGRRGSGKEKEQEKEKSWSLDGNPPESVLPGAKDRPLTGLICVQPKCPPALRNIQLSPFNPPLPPRKMKGDILYLTVDTVEGRRVHVTCCTQGFYVNCSDEHSFKPQIQPNHKTVYHSLVDLLSAVSPGFKRNFYNLIKRRSERPLLDRLPTPYPQYSWLAPTAEASEDGLRAEDATQPHRIGIEDHLPGQIRDWNEELQTTNEMPRVAISERILRDRSIFKIHSDFISAAVRGAQAVVEGNVMAINPADEPKTHMFIWNNIFFSLGFDVKDHYKELGGDAAAFAATSADLQGVRAYSSVDDQRLSTLGMAIIDYRGYRVTAQSIIPGILEREQEQSVVYGSIDFGKTVVSDSKYHELLEKAANELKILPHEVWNGKEGDEAKIVKLYTSFETKGIIGNDSRYYVLDLLRTMPPDVHFLPGTEVSEAAREAGFPRAFPHKLVAFRKELIDSFVEYRYVMFVRIATYNMQLGSEKKEEQKEGETTEKTTDDAPEKTDEAEEESSLSKEALAKAADAVHSLRKDVFDIRFNPDCFSTTVKHADTEDLVAQRRLVVDLGEFLLSQQIPSFIVDCVEGSCTPIDGEGLSEQFHLRGINVRYLGLILKLASDTRAWLRALLGSELIVRSAKHFLRSFLQGARPERMGAAVAHLLNSFFGVFGSDVPSSANVEKKDKKGSKKQSKKVRSEWENITPKAMWKAICDEANSYYGFQLEVNNVDAAAEMFGFQKVSILRRLCKVMGFQLLLKEYALDAHGGRGAIFVEDDVQNVFPVTKHRRPSALDAKRLYNRGQQEMQAGRLRDAYECIAESVNLMTSVYGAMHGELASALRSLARLSYILGDPTDALAQQHKAAIMSERCYGLDHANSIVEYVNLAHLAFANLLIGASLRLLYRARYLLLLVAGESHPFMAQIDGNIGVILYSVQELDLALKFLQSSENISAINGEPKRLKSALIHHIMARAHACRGDFRTALAAEKETFTIYSSIFGASHEKTKESNECLRMLTAQAVTFQKRMNDANKVNIAQLLPLHIQQPTLASVLDVLNVLNGIIVIQVPAGSRTSATTEEGDAVPKEAEAAVPPPGGDKQQLEEETLD